MLRIVLLCLCLTPALAGTGNPDINTFKVNLRHQLIVAVAPESVGSILWFLRSDPQDYLGDIYKRLVKLSIQIDAAGSSATGLALAEDVIGGYRKGYQEFRDPDARAILARAFFSPPPALPEDPVERQRLFTRWVQGHLLMTECVEGRAAHGSSYIKPRDILFVKLRSRPGQDLVQAKARYQKRPGLLKNEYVTLEMEIDPKTLEVRYLDRDRAWIREADAQ